MRRDGSRSLNSTIKANASSEVIELISALILSRHGDTLGTLIPSHTPAHPRRITIYDP